METKRLFNKFIIRYLDFKTIINLKLTCKYFVIKLKSYVVIKKHLNWYPHFNKTINATHLLINCNYLKNFEIFQNLKYLKIIDNKVNIFNIPRKVNKLIIHRTEGKIYLPIRNLTYFRCDYIDSINPLIIPSVDKIVLPLCNHTTILTTAAPQEIVLNYSKHRRDIFLKPFVVLSETDYSPTKRIIRIKFIDDNNICTITVDLRETKLYFVQEEENLNLMHEGKKVYEEILTNI